MKILALSLMLFSLWSCSKNNFQSAINIPGNNSSNNANSTPNDDNNSNPPTDSYQYKALAWEASVPGSAQWSQFVFNYIETTQPQMLGQNVADDVETFCPKYRSLTDKQRLNFWGQLLAGMSKYESNWRPATRYVETTMGTDPVTGSQVASEGLLQLSYQDENNYRIDCGFDWSKDRLLSLTDPNKTIFNPYNNLKCGIMILARQLQNKGAITLSSGVYWAVLKKGGTYNKIPEIAVITKKLTFCN